MSLWQLAAEYLQHLATVARSPNTRRNHRCYLHRFLRRLEGEGVSEAHALRRDHIEAFIEELTWSDNGRGGVLCVATRNYYLISIRGFTHWLYEHDQVASDVGARVAYAKEGETLPRNVPSEAQMTQLLAAPSRRSVLGFRDAMVLELLYASGMRTGEVAGLDIGDVDLEGGWAHVREGKGGNDRVVPLGRRASGTLRCYLAEIRPQLLTARRATKTTPALKEGAKDEDALVLNYKGQRFSATGIGRLVVRYVEAAQLGHVTAHGLRHACATHMMRRGAQIRHLQEMLGHRSVKTTEVYTRLNAQEMLEAHAKYHPREQEPGESG